VPKTRVLLVDMPRLVREMFVRTINSQTDMKVVGQADSPSLMAASVKDTDPEFVIVGLKGAELPVECARFLEARARLRLLGVEAVDGSAFLYELRPDRTRVGEGSITPDGLVGAIRAAARDGD
jgi:DNA-binding NarL/FixJ family response regulator